MDKKKVSILLGVTCAILTLAIVVQIRTISSKISVADPSYVSDDLRDEVLRAREKYEDTFAELGKAQILLEKRRVSATENDENAIEKEEEIKKSEAILGLSEVSGKGIEITLNDNQTETLATIGIGTDPNDYIVHMEDLQNIVNELRNAGAEAISINDQRILANTTFECAGNTIRINGARVAVPFKIKAIGNQDELYYTMKRVGGILQELSDTYKLEVKLEKPATNLTIMKYSGIMKTKYVKEVN